MVWEGLLNVDKPAGITSHDVVGRVRRVAKMRRVGHAGTLDPLATGVLVVCLGRATRLVSYLVGQRKVYEARVRLGQTTDSYDADGVVVAERPILVDKTAVFDALATFRGEIQQQPPMYSAVKRQGQPLYKLARQGIEVERPLRTVTVYEITLRQWQPPFLDLHVACSAGTYIRSLAHDLGELLGCGGHIVALRRTAVGEFGVETAVSLDELTPDNLPDKLLPADRAVAHLPRLTLPLPEAARLCQGQRLPWHSGQPQAEAVRVYNADDQFIGIASCQNDTWQPQKIFHAQ